MHAPGFGEFLIAEGSISEESHAAAVAIQNENLSLREIAIDMNFLGREDLPAVADRMKSDSEMTFGEAAISLGLLNHNQLRYLLDIRTRRRTPIGDILVRKGFIREEVMLAALARFNRLHHRLHSVLIAEPSSMITMALKSMVEKHGYAVSSAKSGERALELARRDRPDILITSGLLPDMEGLELSDTLLADPETSTVKVVLLSGSDDKTYVERAFDRGVNHFLEKPVSERELINVIHQIEKEAREDRPERILIVDDSRGARIVLHSELSAAGFQVFEAEDGSRALEMAKQIRPDIITMDLQMPVMGGFEACRRLKDEPETEEIPVVIISSDTGPQVREQGFEVGAVEFFEKPFKAGTLADYVSLLLETQETRKPERILVVDDSNVLRHMLRFLFKKNGYDVVTATNGEDALAVLAESNPDLIVTDCQMPVKDGFEFTREVKADARFRQIPVIMVTGSTEKQEVVKALAAGANDHVTKPFDEAELLARTGTHLLNKRLFDQVQKERDELERMRDELVSHSEELESLSRTDFLTGAYNRRYFFELAERELARSQRHKSPLSAMILDIDFFKRINDTYGHAVGDEALKALVEVVGQVLRCTDVHCRFGGEEFAALLVETPLDGACQTAERLRQAVEAITLQHDGTSFGFTASIGVVELRDDERKIEQLLNRADEALYRAKDEGRNRVVKG